MDKSDVPLDHPRFRRVSAAIFTARLAPDCMEHECTMVDKERHRKKLDACCQYGCDVDLAEREAILARAEQIRPLLRPEVQHQRWFDVEVEHDKDYPSGAVVRTEVVDDGCLFLQHDRRGCAIHRASIEQGWDFRGVKPAICRQFPMSYEDDAIVLADEYAEYSCAHVDGPSIYRLTRDTLGELFGESFGHLGNQIEAQLRFQLQRPGKRHADLLRSPHPGADAGTNPAHEPWVRPLGYPPSAWLRSTQKCRSDATGFGWPRLRSIRFVPSGQRAEHAQA